MELKDYLKQVAADLQHPSELNNIFNSVFYGSDYETNAQSSDDALYPLCQVLPPLASGVDINPVNGKISDRWQIFIFFADLQPGNMDQTAEQNDPIIQAMRSAAKLYISKLNKSGLFHPITKAEFKHLTFKYDATTAGILAFFTLVEKPGTIYC